MDSPLRPTDSRNVSLYQAAQYQSSPTHSALQPPPFSVDSRNMEFFIEPNLPPTGLLSPSKRQELYGSAGLPITDLTGSPSHFAHLIQSPVRTLPQVGSPYHSPVRVVPASPYRSPIKPGFTNIENSPLVNVTVHNRSDWSPAHNSPTLHSPINDVRFTPQKSAVIRSISYQKTPTASPCKVNQKVQKPFVYTAESGLTSPRGVKVQQQFSPCKVKQEFLSPCKTVNEEPNLDFLLEKLSEEEALRAVGPLLDENQNVLSGSDIGPELNPRPSTSKETFTIPLLPDTEESLLTSGQIFDVTTDVIDGVNVENVSDVDVDVDVLIDDGDINITLSSWDEDKDDGNTEFNCSVCAKTFRRRSALHFHQCLHNGDSSNSSSPSRPCSRSQQDVVDGLVKPKPKKYNKLPELKVKIPIMPPPKRERTFLCEHCGERFPSTSSRANHLNVCDKNCQTFPPNLIKYLGTADDGRLMCTECHKIFNHKSTLKTHIRVHTGEKPCKCRFCGKFYRDHSTLSKHYRVHTNEKPYKCSECSRCFSQSGNMRRHMTHVHKIQLPPDVANLGRQDESPRKRPAPS